MKKSLKRMFGQRFRAGSYATFAAVVIIIIAILANTMAAALPTTYTQLDVTSNSLYSLSDQSKRIASALDKDVNLYLLAVEGNEDSSILRLLERYEGLSDHIHVECVDPTVKPTFLSKYDLSLNTLYANSVLVECGDVFRLVGYDEIYVTSYSYSSYSYYGYTTTTEFDGENALTNAIHYVSSDDLPKVYTLTGHGEAELADYVTEMLEQDNMTVESLSLLTLEAVPEDADVIVISAPETDLSADEAAMLITWLENGGRIVLSTELATQEKMGNLLSVTAAMGMTAGEGLVFEGNSQMRLSRYPHYLLPDLTSHDVTSALIDAGYYILMPMAHPIVETEDSTADITWLMSTSDEAYAKADGLNVTTTAKEDGDEEGSFHVAAASEVGEGRLVWFASSEMLTEYVDQMVSYGNSNLFVNAVSWMCDQTETISIRAKSLDSATLTVPSASASFWSIVMIALIPVGFIALGAIVCIRRKRK